MLTLRDDTRRDGLAMNFLMDELMMKVLASALPGAIINVGYPGICSEELRRCKKIACALADYPVETAVVGCASDAHLAALEEVSSCGRNTSVNVWIPSSERMLRQVASGKPSEFVATCVSFVASWVSTHSTPIDVALVDASAPETDILPNVLDLAERLVLAGGRRVIVGDSMGIGTPRTLAPLFWGLHDRGLPFEFHGHNDNGQLLRNTRAAVDIGALAIGSAVLGLGERKTLGDSRSFGEKFGLAVNGCAYEEFLRLYEDYCRDYPDCIDLLEPNTITSGPQLKLRNRGPDVCIKFCVTSDRRILGEVAGVDGATIISADLRTVKDRMYKEGKCFLSETELSDPYWFPGRPTLNQSGRVF